MADTIQTLSEALETVDRAWSGKRSHKTLYSQAKNAALSVVGAHHRPDAHDRPYLLTCTFIPDITVADVQYATAKWYAEGLSPATVTKRLNCLAKMGVHVGDLRPGKDRSLKWWLTPEAEVRVCSWLREPLYTAGGVELPVGHRTPIAERQLIVADFIEWTTRVGTRIEETLRLSIENTSLMTPLGGSEVVALGSITVPGLKTSASQATLPLGAEATAILQRRYTSILDNGGMVFPITYDELLAVWDDIRAHFCWAKDPTATPKALRRSAARYLHIQKGMPLDMVRQYLRHEDIETTLGYLRLTGGYGTEEMRRWL